MNKPWLVYALVTTGFWGVWGAFAEFPTRHGFPETLVYVVWALTMIPPALYAMYRAGWRVRRDRKSVLLGSLIGLTGAGGQMLLFHAVHSGPTYLIFPIIALSPVITIAMSMLLLADMSLSFLTLLQAYSLSQASFPSALRCHLLCIPSFFCLN